MICNYLNNWKIAMKIKLYFYYLMFNILLYLSMIIFNGYFFLIKEETNDGWREIVHTACNKSGLLFGIDSFSLMVNKLNNPFY